MGFFGLDNETLSLFTLGNILVPESITILEYQWLLQQNELPKEIIPGRTIVLGTEIAEQIVIELLLKKGFMHILLSKKEDLIREINLAIQLLTNPKEVFKNPANLFFSNKNSKNFKYEFSNSKDKSKILTSLDHYLNGIPKSNSIRAPIIIQANELIMNATFSAPTDQKGEHFHQLTDRTSEVELGYEKRACLFAAFNEKQILLGCEDAFGSLEIPKFLEQVQKNYSKGVSNSINFGAGGAGIGSYMIFQSSKTFCLLVEPGIKTIFCSLLPLGLSLKAVDSKPRNIHLLLKS